MEEQDKRKGIIYLTIGLVTLLILVAGATYAYFQAQSGEGKSTDLNATTGTTDNLTFTVSDINVSVPEKIVDEHNKDELNENTDIVINANQDNFGPTKTSLGDGVNGKATLLANNTNNTATMDYNVYFVIKENNFTYTTGEKKTPEVILKVYAPNGTEVKSIEGLSYHEKDNANDKDISGFDITGRKGAFAIESGHTIEVKDGDSGKKEENWKVEVYLINLTTDQLENTGKTITGEVKITTTEEKTYKVAQINTITPETTSSSIEATVKLEEGATNEVTKYYFAIEEKGIAQTVELSEKTKEEINNWQMETENHHTFNELDDNTNYIIYCYVVDSEGFESSIYETEMIATDLILPQITKAEVIIKTYDSIKVEIKETKEGSFPILSYECEISGEGIDTPRIEKDDNTTHTFAGLNELTEYTIKIRAVDQKENKSANYIFNIETLMDIPKKLLADANKSGQTQTLILHNGTDLNDANDESYRYSGASSIVNNYICFGSKNCKETDELYRIIGLFKNSQELYEMKIIKATSAATTQLGEEGAYSGSENFYYWNGSNTEEYDGNWSNDWSKSNLNTENLNDYYLNKYLGKGEYNIDDNPNEWQQMISDHKWITAGNTFDNMSNKTIKQLYQNEILQQEVGEDAFPKVAREVITKVGLMYVSDFMYAASKVNWTKIGYGSNNNDYRSAIKDDWMYNNQVEWTITRSASTTYHAYHVYAPGYQGDGVYGKYVVRPVLYLKPDVKIIDGFGTSTDPYIISQ